MEDDTSNDAVAARLRAAIRARGTTQAKLAKSLKLSNSRVSNWTTGQTPPAREETFRVCDALGITTDYLLRGRVGGMDWDMVEQLRGVAAAGIPPIRRTTKNPRNAAAPSPAPAKRRARRTAAGD